MAKRITIGLKDGTYQILKELCGETGDSMSETVAGLVEASEGVLVRLAAFHRMAREAQQTWKTKTMENFEEVQAELEPVLARALNLLGEEREEEEREPEGPHGRATSKKRGGGKPPSSNTGVRLVRRGERRTGKGGVP